MKLRKQKFYYTHSDARTGNQTFRAANICNEKKNVSSKKYTPEASLTVRPEFYKRYEGLYAYEVLEFATKRSSVPKFTPLM